MKAIPDTSLHLSQVVKGMVLQPQVSFIKQKGMYPWTILYSGFSSKASSTMLGVFFGGRGMFLALIFFMLNVVCSFNALFNWKYICMTCEIVVHLKLMHKDYRGMSPSEFWRDTEYFIFYISNIPLILSHTST